MSNTNQNFRETPIEAQKWIVDNYGCFNEFDLTPFKDVIEFAGLISLERQLNNIVLSLFEKCVHDSIDSIVYEDMLITLQSLIEAVRKVQPK